jgi:cytochrome c biogenesis protein CcdA
MMTKNDIAKLCFKLLAVYFTMQIFHHFKDIIFYLFYNNEMEVYQRANFITSFLPSILFFFSGIILWFSAPNLADSVFKPEAEDQESKVPVEAFQCVAFSVAGLYLLMMSLPAIVTFIVNSQQAYVASGDDTFIPYIIIAGLEIIIGLWLILGSKGIVNAIRKLRRE